MYTPSMIDSSNIQTHGPREKRLFNIADTQAGYFSASQALEAGYSYRLQHYHAKQGHWRSEGHGIYRLDLYPSSPHEHLALLSVWSRDRSGKPQAAVSHESALDLHGISDVMPAYTHLSVPRGFRKQALSGVRLHKVLPSDGLCEAEIEHRDGFVVTTVLRTLVDVARDRRISPEHLQTGVYEAVWTGRLSASRLHQELDAAAEIDDVRREIAGSALREASVELESA